jgi:recombination DNA repair RAD52 pathway protein
MGYLLPVQQEQLLKPINPARVHKDGRGFSHLEAWDIRAHLNRVFGFGRWSANVVDLQLVFEETGKSEGRWNVCYRAMVTLRVDSPEGWLLATYTEAAAGDATNYPSRAEAHDQAIKTAESQALKRAAVNLGDQFGLSLYRDGSTQAVVGKTLLEGYTYEDEPIPYEVTDTGKAVAEMSDVAAELLGRIKNAGAQSDDPADAVKELVDIKKNNKRELNLMAQDSDGQMKKLSLILDNKLQELVGK